MPAAAIGPDIALFALAAAVSLVASHFLVSRLERLGGRLGVSEALLGLVAALAADSPEITSSVSALGSGQHTVGVGVVLGSNVFNIAALLGLGSLVAARIHLHRSVVLLEGAVAGTVVAMALTVAAGLLAPAAALVVCLVVLAGYAVVIGLPSRRLRSLPLPRRAAAWLDEAVCEECLEVGPPEPAPAGSPAVLDASVAGASLLVVVVASVAMERAGVAVGQHFHWAAIVTGGVVLAAVTSLPNAVAAVYLARRGRGTAVLSEAMNSNALNVTVGMLIPAVILGVGQVSRQALGVAGWYGALTVAALAVAFARRGISRLAGALIVCAYAVFLLVLVV